MRLLTCLLMNLCCLNISLQADQLQDAFSELYTRAEWGINSEGKGTSGDGSTCENTKVYRFFLQDFLKTHQIKTVVDFGCGDWEFSQTMDWTGINYTGIDAVKFVVEQNQKKFGNDHIKFIHANGIEMDLPKADLLICKDVLQHLPNDLINKFILQLPKFKHALITNCVDANTLTCINRDIFIGDYRMLDLTKPPFNLSGKRLLTYLNNGKALTAKQVLYISNP